MAAKRHKISRRAHLIELAWKRTHSDYRGNVRGKRAVLVNSLSGTMLQPLSSMTVDELEKYVGKRKPYGQNDPQY